MRNNRDVFINLKAIGITLFTLYMLTASLYIAIFNSLIIQIGFLSIILGVLIINEIIQQGSFDLNKTDVFFILAITAATGSLYGSTFTTVEIAGPIILTLAILISFFIRGSIDNYDVFLTLVKWGGVFYSLSVIFSFIFPEFYNNVFLNLLRPVTAEDILLAMQDGYYTGFTGQVAYTAGYLISAIGIILCSWFINIKKFSKRELILLLILFLGLLLTQKRAHLIFMIFTVFFVYIQYTRGLLQKIIKVFKSMFVTAFIGIPIVFFIYFTGLGNSLFLRIQDTVKALALGEDITSNRIYLWEHAWDIFLQNPLFGIGWGNFRETVIGNVTVHTEMETHNIYLQLLSETGIVGTVFILTPFLITYFFTIKITRLVSRNKDKYTSKWRFAILYSLYTQTFFLLYGLTGNPLYDYSFLIMYFLALGLIYSFWQKCIINIKPKSI